MNKENKEKFKWYKYVFIWISLFLVFNICLSTILNANGYAFRLWYNIASICIIVLGYAIGVGQIIYEGFKEDFNSEKEREDFRIGTLGKTTLLLLFLVFALFVRYKYFFYDVEKVVVTENGQKYISYKKDNGWLDKEYYKYEYVNLFIRGDKGELVTK